jgi:hypothetical protein
MLEAWATAVEEQAAAAAGGSGSRSAAELPVAAPALDPAEDAAAEAAARTALGFHISRLPSYGVSFAQRFPAPEGSAPQQRSAGELGAAAVAPSAALGRTSAGGRDCSGGPGTRRQLRFAPGFVSAVAQAAVGDTSPNTAGAFCLDTGLPCEPLHSTCNGRNEQCHGRGPAWAQGDRASATVIGAAQGDAARRLFAAAAHAAADEVGWEGACNCVRSCHPPQVRALAMACRKAMGGRRALWLACVQHCKAAHTLAPTQGSCGAGSYKARALLSGPLDFRSTFLDMTNLTVQATVLPGLEAHADGSQPQGRATHASQGRLSSGRADPARVELRGGSTCPPAMGMSFAAGTTDGERDEASAGLRGQLSMGSEVPNPCSPCTLYRRTRRL